MEKCFLLFLLAEFIATLAIHNSFDFKPDLLIKYSIFRMSTDSITNINFIRIHSNFKLSIILPCYNKGEFLERAFKSCIDDQELTKYQINLEIICVDDGSLDDTFETFNKMKNKYKGSNCDIQIFRLKKNRGALYAKRYAIQKAKGDYIMFLDADDEFMPGIIHRIYVLLENRKEIDCIQFRLLKLNATFEKNRLQTYSSYTYEVFTYGEYPFHMMKSITLNDPIEKVKYSIIDDYIKNNGNEIDQMKDHARLIKKKDLNAMLPKFKMMWNLPCLAIKRTIVVNALNATQFNYNVKISIYEDLLIAYSSFFFSEKVYFLDEIGYIYYKGAKHIKRVHRGRIVHNLLNNLYKTKRKL